MIAHVSKDEELRAGRGARLGHRRRRIGSRARHAAAARRRRRARGRAARHAAQSRRVKGAVAVAIASVNPSTGETERQFDELTDAELDQKLERAIVAFRAFRRIVAGRSRGGAAARGRDPRRGEGARSDARWRSRWARSSRRDATKRPSAPGAAGSTPSTRRRCSPPSRSPRRRRRQLRALRAARRHPRDHAVELSVLAGVPRRGAGADGRQRRAAEARLERAAVRARDRGHPSAAPASRRASSRRC